MLYNGKKKSDQYRLPINKLYKEFEEGEYKMSIRENNFINLINIEAQKRGATFFVNCGEGREIITDKLDGEDISGWLIPNDKKQDFEAELARVAQGSVLAAVIDEKWDEWFCTAVWKSDHDKVTIDFEWQHPQSIIA